MLPSAEMLLPENRVNSIAGVSAILISLKVSVVRFSLYMDFPVVTQIFWCWSIVSELI